MNKSCFNLLVALSLIFISSINKSQGKIFFPASDSSIQYMGRIERANQSVKIAYPGVCINTRFEGNTIQLIFENNTDNIHFNVIIDNAMPEVFKCHKGRGEYLFHTTSKKELHTLQIVKRTESWQGVTTFHGIKLEKHKTLKMPESLPQRKIMCIGNSITCGAAIDGRDSCDKNMSRTSNGYLAYGMILGRKLNAQIHLVCYGGKGLIRDYTGDTNAVSAPLFYNRALPDDENSQWSQQSYVPDVITIMIGTNDFNQGIPDEKKFVNTYIRFLSDIRKDFPEAKIFITEGPIVGDFPDNKRTTLIGYLKKVEKYFLDISNQNIAYISVSLLNGDSCDAHPTADQHEVIAEELGAVIRKKMSW